MISKCVTYLKRILFTFVDLDEAFSRNLRRKGAHIGSNVQIVDRYKLKYEPWNADLLYFDDGVVVAEGVRFVTHDSSYANVFSSLPTRLGKIRLGKNVYIGVDSVILPGVSIGDYCIIGAGSVVTRDVPPYSIACGNPAKVIGSSKDGLERYRSRILNQREMEYFIDFGGGYSQIKSIHRANTVNHILAVYNEYRKRRA